MCLRAKLLSLEVVVKVSSMLPEVTVAGPTWFCSGGEIFPAMLAAIDDAQESVRFEMYIYSDKELGQRFRNSLVTARSRGVAVRVLVDALGSYGLPDSFWEPLRQAGGEIRLFNPLSLHRLGLRNHRKLLVCDGRVAFVGGFNIAPEYEGDGVTSGWCDLGVRIENQVVQQLGASFDEMYERADFLHKAFTRLRRSRRPRSFAGAGEQVLCSGPGRGRNPIKRNLRLDLTGARTVDIMVAYFLPTLRIRNALVSVARAKGRVRLILAGKSDVPLARIAGRSLYRRLLRAGVEIYEYQPQILHAKLIIIDDKVYVGSANLDQRSLNINYELMVRFDSPGMAAQARAVFERSLTHSQRIARDEWKSRSLWERLKQRWAYLLLVRIDPYLAREQWRALPD